MRYFLFQQREKRELSRFTASIEFRENKLSLIENDITLQTLDWSAYQSLNHLNFKTITCKLSLCRLFFSLKKNSL